jgi:hypothetical protein
MTKTSIAIELDQEGSLREGLETAIRERVRDTIEMVLQEEVEGALEPLLSGAALSKSAVSRLVLRLEESYRTW